MSRDWKAWRANVAEMAKGKTIEALEWDEEERYWVMTFTDGSEICFNRTMAEIALGENS